MEVSSSSAQEAAKRPPLSAVLPPLILGTATFNTQYVDNPQALPTVAIVRRALDLGVRGFDTSPYYGPSETLLGAALAASGAPRADYVLATKAGRVGPRAFDYSAAGVRASIRRSVARLHSSDDTRGYVDLVYAHDVEFVSAAEVLEAVTELRRLRDEERVVRYVGISGYPVAVLCNLAEIVLHETGEPLDAVLSYGHFTVQNRTLAREELGRRAGYGPARGEPSPLARLKAAGVGVVLNASILGMGLLTTQGIPVDPEDPMPPPGVTATAKLEGAAAGEQTDPSPIAKWHPSPPPLRRACKTLAELAASQGERLESVAIHWAIAEWARVGGATGIGVKCPTKDGEMTSGATVIGVTKIAELEEAVREWSMSVLKAPELEDRPTMEAGGDLQRHKKILNLVETEMWPALGREWLDYSWPSPEAGFVNELRATDAGLENGT